MRALVPFVPLSLAAALAALPPAVAAQESAPEPPRPLAPFLTRRVVVPPVQYLRGGDSLGWTSRITDERAYLRNLDAEIRFALSDRGVADRWVFAPALAAMARRNPGYLPDPYALAAQWLRPPMRKKNPDQLPEPFGSQIRSLVAMEDDGQYVLFPVEIRFETAGPGQERALLRVVVLDARRSRIVWMADVASDPAASFSPALAASVAGHLADLVAAAQ